MTVRLITRSEDETEQWGRKLASQLREGDCLLLVGELGAGKTCFVRGIAQGLGVEERVTSPTFVLLREHRGRIALYHLDAYRLAGPEDLYQLGVEELAEGDGVLAVEWGDKVRDFFRDDYLEIEIKILGDSVRELSLIPHGDSWKTRMEALFPNLGKTVPKRNERTGERGMRQTKGEAVLAVDLSYPDGLVALSAGGRFYWRRVEGYRRAADLFLLVSEVLGQAGLERDDIGALGVGRGPGAFTGVRVAVTAAKFLAWAWGTPLVAPSSLEAMAFSWQGDKGLVCPCMDARRKEFYFGLYRRDEDDLEELESPLLGSLERVREKLSDWSRAHGEEIFLLGNADEAVAEGLPLKGRLYVEGPLPEGLLGAVRRSLEREELVSPMELLPHYLRRPDAEEGRKGCVS